MPDHPSEVLLLDSMIYRSEAIDQVCDAFLDRCQCQIDGVVAAPDRQLVRVILEVSDNEKSKLVPEFLNAVLTASLEMHLMDNAL